jgi:hypothetical protein
MVYFSITIYRKAAIFSLEKSRRSRIGMDFFGLVLLLCGVAIDEEKWPKSDFVTI